MLYEWITKDEDKVRQTAEKTSAHLKYKETMIKWTGEYVFARFVFDCNEAMGMNMVTIATEAITSMIEKETGIDSVVAGNFDIDKKSAWLNFINGRGIQAWAEVVIPKDVISDVLKTTQEKLFDTWIAKCMIGSAMGGSMGFNAQFANVIAAIYIATGQDAAHVVEGSMGITTMKKVDKDLYVAVYLPSLMIGIIGGGTHLLTQKNAFSILKLDGQGNVLEFADVIAGAVLAGEISLLASLSAGSLGVSHKKLGRGESL